MNEPTILGWTLFFVGLLVLLMIDLFAHRGGKNDDWFAALGWSVAWIAAGLAFGGFIWWMHGPTAGQEYLAAYLLEKTLSLDNLFVFLLVFQTLGIPVQYQRTALSWGIFGALVFRAAFVFAGAAAIEQWDWLEFVFASLLFWAAIRVLFENPAAKKDNRLVQWLVEHLRISPNRDTTKFFLREDGRLVATPLLIAVVGLELSDIMFAVDSVPAALAVTRHPFLVYTSNAFAILGLRALYIVLAHVVARFRYLHYGLAAVLAFVGIKMAIGRWVEIGPLVSVGIIVLVIGVSLCLGRRNEQDMPKSAES